MSVGAQAEQSFAGLRRAWGVSYSRARRLLLKLPVPWCRWELLVGMEGPISLGIDEHSFRGKDLVITITCLNTPQMVAILPSDRQAELRAALEGLPEGLKGRIVAACIDLKGGFRGVVEQELPLSSVVADPFPCDRRCQPAAGRDQAAGAGGGEEHTSPLAPPEVAGEDVPNKMLSGILPRSPETRAPHSLT